MTGSPPAVVFRASASHGAGFGHVARLCAVIEEASAAGIDPIILFDGDDTLASWSRSQGLAADIRPWTASAVVAAAGDPRVRAVVIDGPALATALAPALAEHCIRTVVIDDRGGFTFPVDAIVNHNFHAPALAATYPSALLCLLGRNYLMLRRAIRRHGHGTCRPRPHARLRVVITFGGSDPVGATARTLRLLPAERPCDAVVIAGPGFQDHEAVRAAATTAATAGHTVEIIHDPADPAALFITADAAICSAGGTLGELAYLGCPALAFAIVADQIAGARAQAVAHLVAGGRAWPTDDDTALRTQLAAFLLDDALRHRLREHALATAGADGARRIVAEALG